MRIPDSKIAEVAAAADIVQVISDYVDLKKAGKDYKGLCPFHGDKDPSFYVSPQKEIFYCFGCAKGGSIFSFLMQMENISFVESVRLLARRYGVTFEFEDRGTSSADKREKLLSALIAAHDHFKHNLRFSDVARGYLEKRGIAQEWIESLGLGFAPDSWDGAVNHLRRLGVGLDDAVLAGLVRQRKSGGHYDYFRSRIMIPIRDLSGDLVAFGGRVLGEGDPKYLNSPESQLFHKNRLLYGLDSAREAIRAEGSVILVEGYFDQISLRTRGLENAVAPLGTALGREQVRLLKRFSTNVVTVFDGDDAGVRAVKRAIPLFLSEGAEPRCLILREDKDPDEAVRRVGIEGFHRLLETSVPMIDFLMESLEEQYDLSTIGGRNAAMEECLPVLREIADSAERDYLIERFSSRIRVREERLRGLLRSGRGGRAKEFRRKEDSGKSLFDFPADERNVVRGMLLRDGFIERVLESGTVKDLEEPVLRNIAEKMIRFREESGGFDSASFCRSLEDERLASMVAGWMQPRAEEDDLRPEVEGHALMDHSLDSIRMRKFQKRKAEIQERMRHCTPGEDEYNRLAQELLAIGRRLHR